MPRQIDVSLYRGPIRKGEAGGLRLKWRFRSQQLANGLAAARVVDPLLERGEADSADHDIAAYHIARRAVEAECLRELEALLQRRLHLFAGHVLLQPRHVEADLLGDCDRARFVGLTAAGEQLLVKFEIFLAA